MIGIDPRFMTIVEWADRMVPIVNQKGGDVGRLDHPGQWKDWATSVILNNQKWQATVPNPNQFDDWRDWAERFLQVMN